MQAAKKVTEFLTFHLSFKVEKKTVRTGSVEENIDEEIFVDEVCFRHSFHSYFRISHLNNSLP